MGGSDPNPRVTDVYTHRQMRAGPSILQVLRETDEGEEHAQASIPAPATVSRSPLGSGTGLPNSLAVSTHSPIASLTLRRASSWVSP